MPISRSASITVLTVQSRNVAADVISLQRTSYATEANLIGVPSLPPMNESAADLQESRETFLGWHASDGTLGGVISYERIGDACLLITRLCIDPAMFRKGIGSELLVSIASREPDIKTFMVRTAAKNTVGIRFYTSKGFVVTRNLTVPEGLVLVELMREKST